MERRRLAPRRSFHQGPHGLSAPGPACGRHAGPPAFWHKSKIQGPQSRKVWRAEQSGTGKRHPGLVPSKIVPGLSSGSSDIVRSQCGSVLSDIGHTSLTRREAPSFIFSVALRDPPPDPVVISYCLASASACRPGVATSDWQRPSPEAANRLGKPAP